MPSLCISAQHQDMESIEDWRLRHSIFPYASPQTLALLTCHRSLKKLPSLPTHAIAVHRSCTRSKFRVCPAPRHIHHLLKAPTSESYSESTSQAKGGNLLEEISVVASRKHLSSSIWGYPHPAAQTQPEASLTIHGPYKDRNLVSLIQRLASTWSGFQFKFPKPAVATPSAHALSRDSVAAPDPRSIP